MQKQQWEQQINAKIDKIDSLNLSDRNENAFLRICNNRIELWKSDFTPTDDRIKANGYILRIRELEDKNNVKAANHVRKALADVIKPCVTKDMGKDVNEVMVNNAVEELVSGHENLTKYMPLLSLRFFLTNAYLNCACVK